MVAAARALAGACILVLVVISWSIIVPQQSGFLALVPIATPHLLLLLIVLLVPAALIARDGMVLGAAILILGTSIVVLGDEWLSFPGPASAEREVTLVSWNTEFGVTTPRDVVEWLQAADADVIALQELTHGIAAAIEADNELVSRFPYQALAPDATVLGLGVLSRYPIADRVVLDQPPTMSITLDLGPNERVVVVNVHPLPGRVGSLSFDATRRDEDLERLRLRISDLLERGVPVLMAGDLNVASSEPAYAEFVRGLRDVHREVGLGPGWTWRPNRLAPFSVGIIRIDYVLVGEGLVPVRSSVACDLPGDHCALSATLAIP